MSVASVKKQPRPIEYDVADDDSVYVTRRPSSARKYQQPIEQATADDLAAQSGPLIQRRRASKDLNTNNGTMSSTVAPSLMEKRWKHFPLAAVVLGMGVTIILVVGLNVLGSWWRMHLDDMQYGRPRTFQFDAVVGHEDSASNPTHFILINLNRHVEIIELPGGDGAHARIYLGPILFGDGQDLTPVTGEVRDVTGDGRLDLIVHIQDQTIVFINTGTQFRPQEPGDHIHL
jgi:hypothetical protein